MSKAITEYCSNSSPTTTTTHCTCIGIDADPNMVDRAKEQFPNIRFEQGDVRNFKLYDKESNSNDNGNDSLLQVDAIFSNAALHWIKEDGQKEAISNMSKYLKSGGRFVVEFGGKGNVEKITSAAIQAIHKKRSTNDSKQDIMISNPWYFPSIGEYCTLLQEYGNIEVTSAILFDRPTPLEDGANGLKNWLRMFGTSTSLFQNVIKQEVEEGCNNAEEHVEEILNEIDTTLRPILFDEKQNQWFADYRRIRIVGKKL